MTKAAAATLQTFWDCRWSRPAQRLGRTGEEPDVPWVCIHDGGRRPVTEAECERCPHWDATDTILERDERG